MKLPKNSSVCYLYCISTSKTGKKYLGMTNNPYQRWEAHKKLAREGDTRPLYKAMRNYGIKTFNFAILCNGPRWFISHAESALILYWKTRHPGGYNLTDGGENTYLGRPKPKKATKPRRRRTRKKT